MLLEEKNCMDNVCFCISFLWNPDRNPYHFEIYIFYMKIHINIHMRNITTNVVLHKCIPCAIQKPIKSVCINLLIISFKPFYTETYGTLLRSKLLFSFSKRTHNFVVYSSGLCFIEALKYKYLKQWTSAESVYSRKMCVNKPE